MRPIGPPAGLPRPLMKLMTLALLHLVGTSMVRRLRLQNQQQTVPQQPERIPAGLQLDSNGPGQPQSDADADPTRLQDVPGRYRARPLPHECTTAVSHIQTKRVNTAPPPSRGVLRGSAGRTWAQEPRSRTGVCCPGPDLGAPPFLLGRSDNAGPPETPAVPLLQFSWFLLDSTIGPAAPWGGG